MDFKNLIRKLKTADPTAKGNIDSYILNDIHIQRGNIDQAYPSDYADHEKSIIESVKPFTMTSTERLVALLRSIDYLEHNKIQGDIVECGVWKGGSMMAAAKYLLRLGNQQRRFFLFDTYEGMSEPTEADTDIHSSNATEVYKDESNKGSDDKWCASPLDDVKQNLASTNYKSQNVFFIKGKVEETLPYGKIDKIAILRLDTDWYESTKHELITLYDRLVPGGVLIIDDYGHWRGAKQAVDEFIAERKLRLFLNRVDYTCRIAIKP